ncbi:MAG TPA: hypothetical protein VII92_04235, partial [Anaerolineae bacterium]
MSDSSILVGRVLRSSTGIFSVGTKVLPVDVPLFGAFVKAKVSDRCHAIGLVYDVVIEDDPLVRQLVAADRPEYFADQQNRQVPIEISVLVVGHARDGKLYHSLPPQPPIALDQIVTCSYDEVVRFTNEFTYFRTVLDAQEARSDELLAASLRTAAEARGSSGRDFLVRAGRELSRLLAFD